MRALSALAVSARAEPWRSERRAALGGAVLIFTLLSTGGCSGGNSHAGTGGSGMPGSGGATQASGGGANTGGTGGMLGDASGGAGGSGGTRDAGAGGDGVGAVVGSGGASGAGSGSGGAAGSPGTGGGVLGACAAASACTTPLVCERYQGPVCADPSWAEWPMPNDAKSGAPHLASYTDNGDDTINDNVTGLMWQKTVSSVRRVWDDDVTYCEALTLAGHDDWRLPTRIELVSLADLGAERNAVPAIDPIFPAPATGPYWSSSTFAEDPTFYAWEVNFFDGRPQGIEKVTMAYARCVR